MVKLDVSLLRYLSPEDFRVLTSVEMGMRNHELVPGPLINSIACLRFGGTGKILVDLTKHKLMAYERGKRYDGYRLTYAGYDYLALNALTHRNVLAGVGNQIGVGKESDVYVCESPESEQQYAIKFHRLGRVCFRKVMEKRDFYTKSKNKTSWMYLSRRAAQREYEFLRFMYQKGMPVPKPIDNNRHVVVMELIDGRILNQYTLESFESEDRDKRIEKLYNNLMDLIMKIANEIRLVHGDFNEFNILIKHNEETNDLEPIIIDLPQMIGLDHEQAPEQFERDVQCIVTFFNKRFHYESDYIPKWEDVDEYAKVEDKMDQFLKDALESIDRDDLDNANQARQHGKTENPNKVATKEDKVKLKKATNILDEDEEDQSSDEETLSNCSRSTNDLVQDIDDCMSQISVMTIDPNEARRKLKAEIVKRESNKKKRDASKPKNIKGDANPVRRRRKTNRSVICDDAAAFDDFF